MFENVPFVKIVSHYLKIARCKNVFGINLSKILDEKYNLAVFSSSHDV